MSVSFSESAVDFRNSMLEFVWQQWCALGIAGTGSTRSSWPIDPEPLLPFSLEIARHDPRVFDEILDWLSRNGEWINVQRLSSMVRDDCPETTGLVAAVAAIVGRGRRNSRWRALEVKRRERGGDSEPLFIIDGRPWNPGDRVDEVFLQYGFRRSPVSLRGLSHEVSMTGMQCLIFRLRAFFGVNARADVIAHLVARGQGHPSEISRLLGFSQKQVQDTLVSLARSKVVDVRPVGRRKVYRVDASRWGAFLFGKDRTSIEWIHWRTLVRGLRTLWRGLMEVSGESCSDYVASSIARRLMSAAREDLLASEMGVSLQDDRSYRAERYLPVFVGDVRNIAARLVGPDRDAVSSRAPRV